LGLKTELGRLITARGVKPIQAVQWPRQALWLYGIVAPLSGDSFFYEFSHLDAILKCSPKTGQVDKMISAQ
jgi:hypothetical protein